MGVGKKYHKILFMAPTVAALLLTTVFPLVYSIVISLFNWNLVKPDTKWQFVGLRNYVNILKNPEYISALKVTLIYVIVVVAVEVVLGVLLALLAFQKVFGTRILRTVVISAMVISPVIVGTAWRLMYNPGYGLINYFLDRIGIGGYGFLADAKTVIPAIMVADVWEWTPLVFLICLSGLQSVSQDALEAASIDGANAIQRFFYITLPALRPSIILAVLMRTMDAFKQYDLIYAMTAGGPGTASQNVNILMYNTAFQYFNVSKGAAMGVLSVILINIVAMFLLKLNKREAV
ncbi:MAG: sugar ABC transporter permease [Lachnospiraceae bacterium]|jgi:multiple sugar transport system permease protein|nr:sugar ABC transporter permease [Lachnospiraceae bacterium]MCI9389679.1 sugar ABC transporter permease [Lachnospiraceae bacterium]MCI9472038.1 sugar ABC transporter permease [Lachnospiraceae bacterium]